MRQAFAIALNNLKSIAQRPGVSLVAVVGVAGVVGVLVAVLSMARGFEQTLETGGAEDVAIVLRSGSSGELDSGLGGEQTRIIEDAPGIAERDGRTLASSELYVTVDLAKKSTGTQANVPLRGVGDQAVAVRDDFELLAGRMFGNGRQELIAGRGAVDQFAGLKVGETLALGQERWDVVGIFAAGGSAIESELWADAPVVQGAYRRGNNYAAVYARLTSAEAFDEFKNALNTDPRLSVKIQRVSGYFAEQSAALSSLISSIGWSVAVLMALGAIFGALNTMYTAVSERTGEIATLRALGFGKTPIVVSVLTESLLLAFVGGAIGAAIAYTLFNGFTVSTLNFSSFTQVVFAFAVTPELLAQGIILALVVGLIGGLAPAIRAARLPITRALRQ